MDKNNKLKYFVYARKSSEGEERQARSIEDQLALIWKRVRDSKLDIVQEFTESQTARRPGRPVFNEMIQRIENGEADAILAWHPDRLARNSIDGGKIMHLLDTGHLQNLLFENFWFEHTSQGMYMLYLAFAQSKYYTDNLSENIRRGIDSKLKRGVYPNWAKRGYTNHPRTKEIIPDPMTFHLVQELFDLYATGKYSFAYLGEMFFEKGLHNNSGGVLAAAQVQRMLKDPFYYGHFRYVGELYEGIHQPCVSKELFDKAQAVMKNKGKAKTRKADNHAFLGLMTCAECGYSITAEEQRGHVYYRCSRKSKKIEKCTQPYLREESLIAQLKGMMDQVTLPQNWLNNFLNEIDKISGSLESRANGQFSKIDSESQKIQSKVSRLADLYIENDLSRAEYLARKEKLLSEKVALLERRRKIANTTERMRLEQMRKPLELLQDWISCASGVDHKKLRDFVSEVGSNMKLNSRELLWNWISPYSILASRGSYSTWR
ncbi:recombinase family protein [Patescibacteria group bacterium]|nr:recombinase family protein [Patescibacteria group bacterium]